MTVRMSIVPTAASNPAQSLQSPSVTSINESKLQPNNQQHQQQQQQQQQTPQSQQSQLTQHLSVSALQNQSSSSSAAKATDSKQLKAATSNSSLQSQSSSITNMSSLSHSQAAHDTSASQDIVYDDINIFMWSVCKICDKSTKKITMSPHTWSFSLAKFLELSFHGDSYFQFGEKNDSHPCKHKLFHDHYQKFRFKNIVTVFSITKIELRQILLPASTLKPKVNICE